MIINHNMNALNAWRNTGIANSKAANSISKLSSGLRINKAGDDAAGLAISEKMRGQIRGLAQASRNIQDGISLIQTAEGGLGEIHSLIQRGRELAVQGANGTLTSEDKEKIQAEVSQIIEEVDRISVATEFNNIKLLNVFQGSSDSVNNVIQGLKTGWLEASQKLIEQYYGLVASKNTPVKIFLDTGSPGGTLAYAGGSSAQLELHIDMSDFNPATLPNGENPFSPGQYGDRIIAHEMTHLIMNDVLGIAKMNDFHTNNALWFVEGTAEFIQGADERLKSEIYNSTASGIDNTKLDSLISRAKDLLNGAVWSGSSKDYAAGYLATKYLDSKLKANGTDFKTLMQQIQASAYSGTQALKDNITALTASGTYAAFVSDFESNANAYVHSLDLQWGIGGDGKINPEIDTGSIAGSDHGGSAKSPEDVVATEALNETPLTGFQIIWPNTTLSREFNLQIGANEGQVFKLSLADVTSGSLGIKDANVSSSPSEAITKFDDAINNVSNQRARFGAAQNRLEHAMQVANISEENLTSSESRIRDFDMAKGMMDFSKNNIIMQAAQAMLVQANNSPQQVLQLLR